MTTTTIELNTKPEMINIPGFGPQQPRTRYLGSVHFAPLYAHRPHGRGFGKGYLIPAVDVPGTIKVLPVYDTFQVIRRSVDLDSPPRDVEMPIPVDLVVSDLIDHWTTGFVSDRFASAAPGVGEVHLTPEGDVLPEELARLWAREQEFCRLMVEDADELYVSKKAPILRAHRRALEFLGSQDAIGHPWYREVKNIQMKRSPITGNDIRMEAFIDQGIKLIEFYIEMELDPLDYGDTFLAPYVQKKREELEARKGGPKRP